MMALRLFPYQPVRGLLKGSVVGALDSSSCDQVRTFKANKHRDHKFKNLRRLKVGTTTPMKYFAGGETSVPGSIDELRAMRDGYSQYIPNLHKLWQERDVYISCSSLAVDEFVPPESKGRALTAEVKKQWNNIGNFGKDKFAIRKIRGYESEFNLQVFQQEALEIYKNAHEVLAKNDQEKLIDYVTEHARLQMMYSVAQRTVRWKYLQSLEEPKVVQVRAFQVDGAENLFAQITLRLFSQQCLAVYDRFGRLLYGSEVLAKDVLEYCVFEKHLSNQYGMWRLHEKIVPHNRVKMAEHTFAVKKELPEETKAVVPEITSQSSLN